MLDTGEMKTLWSWILSVLTLHMSVNMERRQTLIYQGGITAFTTDLQLLMWDMSWGKDFLNCWRLSWCRLKVWWTIEMEETLLAMCPELLTLMYLTRQICTDKETSWGELISRMRKGASVKEWDRAFGSRLSVKCLVVCGIQYRFIISYGFKSLDIWGSSKLLLH